MTLSKKILLAVAVIALVGAGLSRLRLEADILATLPPELPEVAGLKLLRDTFDGGDDLIIGLEASDPELSQKVAAGLSAHLLSQQDLVRRVRSEGTFEKPEQAGALLAWTLQNEKPAGLAAIKERLEGDKVQQHLENVLSLLADSPDPAVVQRWSYDPLGLLESLDIEEMAVMQESSFVLASADGTFRVLFVSPLEKVTGYKEAGQWLVELQSSISDWIVTNGYDDVVKLHFTGEPAFLAETGAGIEKDMRSTIGMTEVLITLLFWVMFRRLLPLLWIHLLLVVIMLLTLSLASLFLGKLSVMSLGFAAIVLGIVVDYAVLILQKSHDHPELDGRGLRRLAAPGIIAGAATTSVVFLSLLFSGLPGLGDLGVMVALGVLAGLVVMLSTMPVIITRKKARLNDVVPLRVRKKPHHRQALFATLAVVVLVAGVLFMRGVPAYQTGADALRPSKSSAMSGWDVVQQRLGKDDRASVPLLVTGDERTLRQHAEAVNATLTKARREGVIVAQAVPAVLLPDVTAQEQNLSVIRWLSVEKERLTKAVLDAGFTEDSLQLFNQVIAVWQRAMEKGWPQSVSQSEAVDVVGRIVSGQGNQMVMLGSVILEGSPGVPDADKLVQVREQLLVHPEAHLTGWESLGSALSHLMKRDAVRMTLPLIILLIVMLLVTFRNVKDILLSVLVLSLGVAGLLATMALFNLSWNLASLAALPLLMGTGLDYSIHILLALEKEQDDVPWVQATTGKAVFFSGMTTVIGFSSLMFAGNQGIASLGLACCVGTAWVLALVLWLLPYWRLWLGRLQDSTKRP